MGLIEHDVYLVVPFHDIPSYFSNTLHVNARNLDERRDRRPECRIGEKR